jgi:predicted DNA-binding transcriptional regulator YafY
MEAGVPIGSEAGKGYFIVDGYHLPPVMFSQQEASAMLTAGKLVEKMTDASIRQAYESALLKIKSVLNDSEKDHLENLQSSIEVFRFTDPNMQSPNQYMAEVQRAIAQKQVMMLEYVSSKNQELTRREVEPIGVVYYSGNWHMIAWCRLRNGYRDFRTDLFQSFKSTGNKFDARHLLTLQEYFRSLEQAHRDMEKVVVSFDKAVAPYTKSSRYYYGFVSEEEVNDRCSMTFLTWSLRSFARWLLMYGNAVQIESPEKMQELMEEMVEELTMHYKTAIV